MCINIINIGNFFLLSSTYESKYILVLNQSVAYYLYLDYYQGQLTVELYKKHPILQNGREMCLDI